MIRFAARNTHRHQPISGRAPFDDALESRPEHEISWASLKPLGAIGAVVARFVHTEEVTGSNPVSPTKSETGSGLPNHPQRPGE
jgi:hypothetical protein